MDHLSSDHAVGARRIDVILVGGGAAGLSLAYHLGRAYPDIAMLIVDEEVKNQNDHTWCFWSREASYLDELAYRSWDQLMVTSETFKATYDLAPYRYQMIRAADFYRFMRAQLTALPNVDIRLAKVDSIADGQEWAEVLINEVPFQAQWIFDSRYQPSDYRALSQRYRYLTQHFLGWEIETTEPCFKPQIPRLFDFRTPQGEAMRFFYVLPFSETHGLVEYTLFSARVLPVEQYQVALKAYIEDVLGVRHYRILDEERDLIPMTDHPFPRRAGRRILNIGTRGGRVKPSSGYAFQRIQEDARAIVRSLEVHSHPFDLPQSPPRYRMFDAMLLQILHRQGHLGKPVFLRLFQRNPIQRIFRFLDEEDGLWENLKVMASVPPLPFARAWLRIVLLRRA